MGSDRPGRDGGRGVNPVAAGGFAAAGPAYAPIRPTYARAAIGVIKQRVPAGAVVVDLAAGTGILSGQLRRAGMAVLSIEPVPEMLGQLRLTLPEVPVVRAVPEALPLASGSVDAVTVGEALQWFGDSAVSELRRVLRVGGVLAIARNRRGENVDWMARYGEILRFGLDGALPHVPRDPERIVASAGGFSAADHVSITNPRLCTPGELVRQAASTSFVAAAPADVRSSVLGRVRELARTHPDLAGRESFEMSYVTEVWTWTAL